MTATKSTQSKVAYIFKDNVWYPITGLASTTENYTWTGTHTFNQNPVSFEKVVTAKAGVNNFVDETARDAAFALVTPIPHGTVAFVKNINGTVANQIQYYSSTTSTWVNYTDTSFVPKTSDYTLALSDSGRTITVNSGSTATITVPANSAVAFPIGTRIDIVGIGSGTVAFGTSSGVTLNSKNPAGTQWLKLNGQYAGATLLKIDTNIWVLIGDLKS